MTTAGKEAWNKLSVSYAIVSISYTLQPNLVYDLGVVLNVQKQSNWGEVVPPYSSSINRKVEETVDALFPQSIYLT